MYQEERRYIGRGCFLCLSSKPELVNPESNTRIKLGFSEYKVFSFLVDNANHIVSLEELAYHLWGANYKDDPQHNDYNSVKSHISRIRQKLDKIQPGLNTYLETVQGFTSYIYILKDKEPSESKEMPENELTEEEIEKTKRKHEIPTATSKEPASFQRTYPKEFDLAMSKAKERSVLQQGQVDLTGFNIHSEADIKKQIVQCEEQIIQIAGVDGLDYKAYFGFKYPIHIDLSQIEKIVKVNEEARLSRLMSVIEPFPDLKKTMDSIMAEIHENDTFYTPTISVDDQEYDFYITVLTKKCAYFYIVNEADPFDYLFIKAVTDGLKVRFIQLESQNELEYVLLCLRGFCLKELRRIAFEEKWKKRQLLIP